LSSLTRDVGFDSGERVVRDARRNFPDRTPRLAWLVARSFTSGRYLGAADADGASAALAVAFRWLLISGAAVGCVVSISRARRPRPIFCGVNRTS
jgi:hypothetical protein